MFIYNLKVNSKNIVKIIFIIMSIIITIFFIISIYRIISESIKVRDENTIPDISYIEPNNYTNILKEVYDDLDTYTGQKISFTGYIYRNSDFDKNHFVLARDMETSIEGKTLVVGFLCNCENAQDFQDDTWVEIIGTIEKGNYHGEIPILKIIKIEKTDEPEIKKVPPPDDTYVQTSIIGSFKNGKWSEKIQTTFES